MTKLVAIHLLHLASAVKGEVEVIEPGQVFIAREEELRLTNGGIYAAAREYAAEHDKGRKEFVRAASVKAISVQEAEDLSKLTKAQLVALAAKEEIVIDDKATNGAIIEAIKAARAAKAAEDDDGI